MNNKVVSEQTQKLIELISQHYQYYYQQSSDLYASNQTLPLDFYQRFIANLIIELEHIDFAFPVTANLVYCANQEQVVRWALYWQLEFHQSCDVDGNFTCTIELKGANQKKLGFKLICDSGTSQYSTNKEIIY